MATSEIPPVSCGKYRSDAFASSGVATTTMTVKTTTTHSSEMKVTEKLGRTAAATRMPSALPIRYRQAEASARTIEKPLVEC
jgi:hypothetical protein